MTKPGRIGSSFDSFLKEESIYEEVTAAAIKRALALRIESEVQRKSISMNDANKHLK